MHDSLSYHTNLDTGVTLVVTSTVHGNSLEGTTNSISPEPLEESLEISPVSELIEISGNTNGVFAGSLGNVSAGVVKSTQASGSNRGGAAGGNSSEGTGANEFRSNFSVAVNGLDIRLQTAGCLHAFHGAKVGGRGDGTDVAVEDRGKTV